MNKEYWRDPRDFFKRGFLQALRTSEQSPIQNLKVFPCFTGFVPSETDTLEYCDLLGVRAADILNRGRFFPRQGRPGYFDAAGEPDHFNTDLFIDPDKGIATELQEQAGSNEHITNGEIAGLLSHDSKRIVLIYEEGLDHQGHLQNLQGKLQNLHGASLPCFAYHGGAINLVFVSGENGGQKRLEELRKFLSGQIKIPPGKLVGI